MHSYLSHTFRRHIADLPPLYINSDCVERVQDFTFLGTVISADLSWAANTSTTTWECSKGTASLQSCWWPPSLSHPEHPHILHHSVVHTLHPGWVEEVNTVQEFISCPHPSVADIYTSHYCCRADAITQDSTHPPSHLFDLLPSGRLYRSIQTKTSRLTNSFFPWTAVLNTRAPQPNSHISTAHTHTTHTRTRFRIYITPVHLYSFLVGIFVFIGFFSHLF